MVWRRKGSQNTLKASVGVLETGQEARAGHRQEGAGRRPWASWSPGAQGSVSEGESLPHSSLRRGRERHRGKCGLPGEP